MSIGYVPIEQAIFEVLEANAKAKEIVPTKRLVERMNDGQETIAELLDKIPTTGVKQCPETSRQGDSRCAWTHYSKCSDYAWKPSTCRCAT
ncbi:hypothetical protein [Paraburkholderia franconis]